MDPQSYQRRRETILVTFLAGATLIGLLFVFTILTGGFLIYVLAAVLGIAALAGFHYLVWGWFLSERFAGLREELELRDAAEAEAEPWGEDDPRRPRHY